MSENTQSSSMDRLERLVRLAEEIQEREGCDFDEASQRAGRRALEGRR